MNVGWQVLCFLGLGQSLAHSINEWSQLTWEQFKVHWSIVERTNPHRTTTSSVPKQEHTITPSTSTSGSTTTTTPTIISYKKNKNHNMTTSQYLQLPKGHAIQQPNTNHMCKQRTEWVLVRLQHWQRFFLGTCCR